MSDLIECWSCKSTIGLSDVSEADGLCPRCDAEIDLDGYRLAAIEQLRTERDQLQVELAALRTTHPAPASVGGVETELAKLETGMPRLMQANYDLRQQRDAALAECERLREALSGLSSAVKTINRGRQHQIHIKGDDEPCYWQRKEWVDYLLELCVSADAELSAKP